MIPFGGDYGNDNNLLNSNEIADAVWFSKSKLIVGESLAKEILCVTSDITEQM